MSKIVQGRFTAHSDQPFVVFLIGMRVNNLLAIRKWWPVFTAMGPMLSELREHPELGLLGTRLFWSGRVVLLVQYWRSFDALEAFARSPNDLHLPAWRRYNETVAKSGVVGIFHETYLIDPNHYEAVYNNMPVFGLARATQHVPAIGQRETARRRIGGENEPAVTTPV